MESVYGLYHENPSQKRSSIDVQFGPIGRISSYSDTPPPYPFVISRGPDCAPIFEAIEEEQEVSVETHGTSNPAFVDDETENTSQSTDNEVHHSQLSTAL